MRQSEPKSVVGFYSSSFDDKIREDMGLFEKIAWTLNVFRTAVNVIREDHLHA